MTKLNIKKESLAVLAEKAKKTDGSVEQIAELLECEAVDEVNVAVLQTLKDRWSVYGNVWQNEEEDDIERVLKAAGGDPKTASLIVKLRSINRGTTIMRPPVVFNLDGTKFVPEPLIKSIDDATLV